MNDNETVKEWLDEYSVQTTEDTMKIRLKKFLEGSNTSIETFLGLTTKEAKHIILKYVADEKAKGTPDNSILADITAPRSLFSYLEKSIKFRRGQLPNIVEAQNKHHFSNGDLSKMFAVADLRGKTLIAVGSSLGWAISDVLALDRNIIEAEIKRAKEEKKDFVFINRQRIKTNAKAYGILNSLAIELLDKWFAQYKGEKLFDVSEDQINKDLQRIAVEGQLTLTGNVSFHCFRAWTYSTLVKSGLSNYASDYAVGKSVPIDKSTYLNLEDEIETKYPKIYREYFDFTQKERDLKILDESKQLRTQLEESSKTISVLLEKIRSLESGQQTLSRMMNIVFDKLDIKKPKPEEEKEKVKIT